MILDDEEWAAFQQYINRKTITPQEQEMARLLRDYQEQRIRKRREALIQIVPDLTQDQVAAIEALFSSSP